VDARRLRVDHDLRCGEPRNLWEHAKVAPAVPFTFNTFVPLTNTRQ
jgi:hypothetical protein